ASKGEDLINELTRPFAGVANLIKMAPARASGTDLRVCHFGVSDDRADDVVEIVSDAAGECADRLHASGLLQIGFEPLLFLFKRDPSHGIVDDVEGHPKNPDFAMLGQRMGAKRVESQDRTRFLLVASCDTEPAAKPRVGEQVFPVGRTRRLNRREVDDVLIYR